MIIEHSGNGLGIESYIKGGMVMAKFKLDINLDDKEERDTFLDKYGVSGARQIANRLGLKGKGSVLLAQALRNYAWNAHTAYEMRLKNGYTNTAIMYEEIADRIYREDIQPVCERW
jgi:hypothetical protein